MLPRSAKGCRTFWKELHQTWSRPPRPPVAAVSRRAVPVGEGCLDAEEAEFQAEEARNQKVCDSSPHRPRVKPVRVARDRTMTDYGVLESFECVEGAAETPREDDLLGEHIELMDPMDGQSDLPNLAFRGKGHCRIRVHYRRPDSDAWTPQHILVMVYPGEGRPVIEYRRKTA